MHTKVFWYHPLPQGKIGIAPRPRNDEWITLASEIQHFKSQGIDTIVSLLERAEARFLGLHQEAEICEKYEVKFINFPIVDVSIPPDIQSFTKLMDELNEELQADKTILVHCRMGIGRCSMTLAALLASRGIAPHQAFQEISQIRGVRVPDTEEQIKFAASFKQTDKPEEELDAVIS
jgi:protein-tyrosine phosphatase